MMTTNRLTLIVATAFGLGLATREAPAEEPKGDLAKLQGTWSAKVGPNKDIPLTLLIKENVAEITVARPDGDELRLKGKLKLNDQASPKTLDWVEFTGPQGDVVPTNLGIYKLEGDSWTTCSGGPGNDRPSKFEAGEGAPPTMTTWARVKEKVKDKPDPKPIEGDLARFQGNWTGKAGADGDIAVQLTVQGNAVTAKWSRGDGTELVLKGELRVNDQARPRTVDFFNFKRSDGEDTKDNLGIYAFEGDQVKICTGGPGNERPTELKAGDGGQPNLFVFTRRKD